MTKTEWQMTNNGYHYTVAMLYLASAIGVAHFNDSGKVDYPDIGMRVQSRVTSLETGGSYGALASEQLGECLER